ncbi:MAG: hypothetical protein ABIH11_01425 [Candidatus Altiarchaeota archaeon]
MISRRVWKNMLLLALTSLICLAVIEAAARIMLPEITVTRYGWGIEENTSEKRSVMDPEGVVRNFTVEYSTRGFKRWGDPDSDRKKMLVIGDSYTHMMWTPNGEEYYAYLEEEFDDMEFFVFGASEYGPLQEYLIIDDYYDAIKPDVILWQFCGNDYRNSNHVLDSAYYPCNNRHARPYLEGDDIVYRYPTPLSWVRMKSRAAKSIVGLYENYVQARRCGAEDILPASPELEADAFNTTLRIMMMVRERVGDTPIYLFSTDNMTWREEEICRAADMACIPGVAEHLLEKESEGVRTTYRPLDGHWTPDGNKYVGEYLAEYFKACSMTS